MKAAKKGTSLGKQKKTLKPRKAEKKAGKKSSTKPKTQVKVKVQQAKTAAVKKAEKKVHKSKQIFKKVKTGKSPQSKAAEPAQAIPSPAKRLATRRSTNELPGLSKVVLYHEKTNVKTQHAAKPASKATPKIKILKEKKTSKKEAKSSVKKSKLAEVPKRRKLIQKKVKPEKTGGKDARLPEKSVNVKTEIQTQLVVKEAQLLSLEKLLESNSGKLEELTTDFKKIQESTKGVKQDVAYLTSKVREIAILMQKNKPSNEGALEELQSQLSRLQKVWQQDTADLKKAVTAPSRAPQLEMSKLSAIIKPVAEKVELISKQQGEILQSLRQKKIQKDPSPLKEEKTLSPVQKKKQRQAKASPKKEVENPKPVMKEKVSKPSKVEPSKQIAKDKIEAVEALLHASADKVEAAESTVPSSKVKTPQKESEEALKGVITHKDSNKGKSDTAKAKLLVTEEKKHNGNFPKPNVHSQIDAKPADKPKEPSLIPLDHLLETKVSPNPTEDYSKVSADYSHGQAPANKTDGIVPKKSVEVRDFSISFNAQHHALAESLPENSNELPQSGQKHPEISNQGIELSSVTLPLPVLSKQVIEQQAKTFEQLVHGGAQEQKLPESLPLKIFFDKSEEAAAKGGALPDAARHFASKPDEKRNFFS